MKYISRQIITEFPTKIKHDFLSPIIVFKVDMLFMFAIKDYPLNNLLELHSSISLKLTCCIDCLHFVLDIQAFLVVVKKVSRDGLD